MAQKIVPNQYDLLGPGVTVNYSTSSFGGQPQLSFKKGRQTLNFSGKEIEVLDTGIGALVTVTIATTVDRGTTTFSFLLPEIQIAAASGKQSFKTIGLTTIHKTSIAGPVPGAQEAYTAIQLKGTARQVQFLTQQTAGV